MPPFLQFALPLILNIVIVITLAATFVVWIRQRSLGEPPGYFKIFPGTHRH